MRIVAGTARGRTLKGPKSQSIRPTADRVRESVFNILGQWLVGQRVLDLFAGTGAMAFEAISRGAISAVLVDKDREALSLCRANAEALGFASQVQVIAMPVEKAVGQLQKAGQRFDVVFADPPYAAEAIEKTLVQAQALLVPQGTFVVEYDKREAIPSVVGSLERADEREFGATRVAFFRFLAPATAGDESR
jgi:16S rRNA (guanine(966)-N(2))-methyltransferase RsmD